MAHPFQVQSHQVLDAAARFPYKAATSETSLDAVAWLRAQQRDFSTVLEYDLISPCFTLKTLPVSRANSLSEFLHRFAELFFCIDTILGLEQVLLFAGQGLP